MEKEKLLQRMESMIQSSTKVPKYMCVSTVKIADLFGTDYTEVEAALRELIDEGKLKKFKLDSAPHQEVYQLP